jgi:hypothetical protein
MPDDTPSKTASDFESAAAVVNVLVGLPKPKQELILRWVLESLGISAPPLTSSLSGAAPPNPAPVAPALGQPAQPPGVVDIASFVAEKAPRSDIQFVTVAAYYYRFVAPVNERRNTISPDVAQNATRLANRDRLAAPKNTLNNAKKQGYLDSAERGEYSINTVGENLVARTLPRETGGNRRTITRKKSRGTAGSRKRKTSRQK